MCYNWPVHWPKGSQSHRQITQTNNQRRVVPQNEIGLLSLNKGELMLGSKKVNIQFGSVAWSCPTLCDPMTPITPGLPVHHQLPEFTETHVHQVGDAIQPSHPLSSPSPPAPNPSQHQSLFQ